MKSQLFLIILSATIMMAQTVDTTATDYYDPNDDQHHLVLWKGLFIKLNTLLLETDKVNQNLLDMNKRIDDIGKRQADQETQIIKLMETVNLNSKYLNDGLAASNKRQENQKTQLTNLMTNVQLNTKYLNESRVDCIEKQAAQEETAVTKISNPSTLWTTILRRQDGSVNFSRNWSEYKKGFGNPPEGEFFIGLEKLHELTAQGPPQELMIVLKDWQNEERTAQYDLFKIGGEQEKYMLKELGQYSGDAEDALEYHKGMKFSTADQDNDGTSSDNCAKRWDGAWWFNNCYNSHLNGPYRTEKESHTKGVGWMKWKGHDYSLKFAEMKIRPKSTL